MNELNQVGTINEIVDKINDEMISPEPHPDRIISQLIDLRELLGKDIPVFYDIVGGTFKLNPEFFMKSIYRNPVFQKDEITKHIIEKFCLYQGEEILFEFQGDIKQIDDVQNNIYVSVTGGTIFITNYRIIAHGKLKAKGHSFNAYIWGGSIAWLLSGGSKRAKSREALIDKSAEQKLPCYGYQFNTRNHVRLKKKSNGILYSIIGEKPENIANASRMKQVKELIKAIRMVRITLPYPKREIIDRIYEVLSKDVNHTFYAFLELHEMKLNEKLKRNEFLYRLKKLWDSEEYKGFTSSNYLDVVDAVYNLDPEFFMTFIYPKMISWKFPGFLQVKNEINDMLRQQGANIN
ncbi:MAG: hypothetical protein ACFE9C_08105 [Candidatus Hodarchaeota archaeon]